MQVMEQLHLLLLQESDVPLHALDLVLQGYGLHRNQIHGPGLRGAEMARDQTCSSTLGLQAPSREPLRGAEPAGCKVGDCSHLPLPRGRGCGRSSSAQKIRGEWPPSHPPAPARLGAGSRPARARAGRLRDCMSRKRCCMDPGIGTAHFYFEFGPRKCFITEQDCIWDRIAPRSPQVGVAPETILALA